MSTQQFTAAHHTRLDTIIKTFSYHQDRDLRTQALRDVVELCSQIKGQYPRETQEILAPYFARCLQDRSGHVSLYALNIITNVLGHLSVELIVEHVFEQIIQLLFRSDLSLPDTNAGPDDDFTYNFPLFYISFGQILNFLVQNLTNQEQKNGIVAKIYKQIIPKCVEYLNQVDNPDVPPAKSPSIQFKKAIPSLILPISIHLSGELSTTLNETESNDLLNGYFKCLHHFYEPITKACGDTFGNLISLFKFDFQKKSLELFFSRLSNPEIVPLIFFAKNFEQFQSQKVILSNGDSPSIYTPGQPSLNITQIYILSLTTIIQSLPTHHLSPYFPLIVHNLLISLPDILKTTNPFSIIDEKNNQNDQSGQNGQKKFNGFVKN